MLRSLNIRLLRHASSKASCRQPAVTVHEPMQPGQSQQPPQPEQWHNEVLEYVRSTRAEDREAAKRKQQETDSANSKLNARLSRLARVSSAVGRRYGSIHEDICRVKLALAVGLPALQQQNIQQLPQRLHRSAAPLEAADIPAAVAQSNLIHNILQVHLWRTCTRWSRCTMTICTYRAGLPWHHPLAVIVHIDMCRVATWHMAVVALAQRMCNTLQKLAKGEGRASEEAATALPTAESLLALASRPDSGAQELAKVQ
jgi:hypothetical protein